MNDWTALLQEASRISEHSPDRTAQMTEVVDLLWEKLSSRGLSSRGLSSRGLSWIGFYLDQPGQPAESRLILGPRRDKPACSPIGLHGACGRCLLTCEPLIVRDVRELGSGYIACDPLDQSELVLPCFHSDGSVWGVLDADSHFIGHFTLEYQENLTKVLHASGLSSGFSSGLSSGLSCAPSE